MPLPPTPTVAVESLRDAWRDRSTQRKVRALAIPMMISNVSVPLVGLVDTAVIGHLPQAQALAAVVLGGGLYSLLLGILGILRMSATGFTAQALGRGDADGLRLVLLQSVLLGLLLAALAAALAVPLCDLAMRLASPDGALDALAREFLGIRLYGLPAALLSATLIGWLLGTQQARAALAVMLLTNLANILLNLWFVLGLDWGVTGSARASLLAEWLGAGCGLWLALRVLRRHPGRLDRQRLWQPGGWLQLLAVNRDILLRSLALHLALLCLTLQGTRLGENTLAGNALLLNGLLLTSFALDGLAHALEALCGHALGAGDRRALRRALVVSGGWALLGSLLFALAFALFGEGFIALQSDLPEVRQQAGQYLPYLAVLPLVSVWSYLLDGLFIGATRAREMRNAMLLSLTLALLLGWLLQGLGNHGLWLAFLAFMLLRGLSLAAIGWQLQRRNQWFGAAAIPPAD